ncbi:MULTISPECIES: NAD(P)-dependent oxidoreductase [Actinoalloteichus]|uniref:Beta-hydroxyacid dehydrogenase, 3-hydroxyisobutyrate dehydrogenase n=1 Tax=Actinoalloteichus fjordicus TaxID=1612552 RepID=A0AAC9LEV3_9PSEU|nr:MULTISPECIES: NAD(P)-binding domain-containing protein [Actinoalloteichus]APU15025.1 beta-hydroxyacid dehydrogenase, 3-hydroxyisobutyrate dehydrogenase [Actinoalloteichus fjordicus]APU21093.1 beta-hydroxyacid dehydrogenase, 3-hydroxyisobutyrate dehydrogenase [Actinoalloteichus sp. GBA129-24]
MPEHDHSTTPATPVTIIGLGAMGTALADAFLAAGHPTTVWNRSPGRVEALVARGARRANSAADAVAAGPLVIACVLDYPALHEILDASVTEALRGRTLVNLTNGIPGQARATADWAREHGIEYLDGGIMAIPPTVATPGAFFLYSGPDEVLDAHRATLEVLGEVHHLGTDPGLAALQDLALLTGMYGMFAGILQAFALVDSEGIPTKSFAPMLRRWLTDMAISVDLFAQRIDADDHDTGVMNTLAMQTTGVANLAQAGREQGVDVELLAPLYALMQRRVADGHGQGDVAGLFELIRRPRVAG